MVMGKQKYRDRGKQGLTVKKRAGRRAFGYQIPPEVADQLPPGTSVTIVSLTNAEIYALARQAEPEVTRWLAEKPAKNALEALLLLVQAIYALLQPPELPVPHKELVEIAQTLAQGYDFADTWPYSSEEMRATMTPGHPDLRPNVPDEHILFIAQEVEERLIVQMAAEGVVLRDATQAGMLVVTMTHKMLFDEASVFGADQHEMYHVARVLVASHTFHKDWPYRDQVIAALVKVFHLPQE
jgi:hypothetical protein